MTQTSGAYKLIGHPRSSCAFSWIRIDFKFTSSANYQRANELHKDWVVIRSPELLDSANLAPIFECFSVCRMAEIDLLESFPKDQNVSIRLHSQYQDKLQDLLQHSVPSYNLESHLILLLHIPTQFRFIEKVTSGFTV